MTYKLLYSTVYPVSNYIHDTTATDTTSICHQLNELLQYISTESKYM